MRELFPTFSLIVLAAALSAKPAFARAVQDSEEMNDFYAAAAQEGHDRERLNWLKDKLFGSRFGGARYSDKNKVDAYIEKRTDEIEAIDDEILRIRRGTHPAYRKNDSYAIEGLKSDRERPARHLRQLAEYKFLRDKLATALAHKPAPRSVKTSSATAPTATPATASEQGNESSFRETGPWSSRFAPATASRSPAIDDPNTTTAPVTTLEETVSANVTPPTNSASAASSSEASSSSSASSTSGAPGATPATTPAITPAATTDTVIDSSMTAPQLEAALRKVQSDVEVLSARVQASLDSSAKDETPPASPAPVPEAKAASLSSDTAVTTPEDTAVVTSPSVPATASPTTPSNTSIALVEAAATVNSSLLDTLNGLVINRDGCEILGKELEDDYQAARTRHAEAVSAGKRLQAEIAAFWQSFVDRKLDEKSARTQWKANQEAISLNEGALVPLWSEINAAFPEVHSSRDALEKLRAEAAARVKDGETVEEEHHTIARDNMKKLLDGRPDTNAPECENAAGESIKCLVGATDEVRVQRARLEKIAGFQAKLQANDDESIRLASVTAHIKSNHVAARKELQAGLAEFNAQRAKFEKIAAREKQGIESINRLFGNKVGEQGDRNESCSVEDIAAANTTASERPVQQLASAGADTSKAKSSEARSAATEQKGSMQ